MSLKRRSGKALYGALFVLALTGIAELRFLPMPISVVVMIAIVIVITAIVKEIVATDDVYKHTPLAQMPLFNAPLTGRTVWRGLVVTASGIAWACLVGLSIKIWNLEDSALAAILFFAPTLILVVTGIGMVAKKLLYR